MGTVLVSVNGAYAGVWPSDNVPNVGDIILYESAQMGRVTVKVTARVWVSRRPHQDKADIIGIDTETTDWTSFLEWLDPGHVDAADETPGAKIAP